MTTDFWDSSFRSNADKTALIWNEKNILYNDLLQLIKIKISELNERKVKPGEVIALIGDFTPNSIALLFALIKNNNIIVPLNYSQKEKNKKKLEIALVEGIIEVSGEDQVRYSEKFKKDTHKHYKLLTSGKVPGLVLFTSGTSGEPKAAVHDFSRLLKKFEIKRNNLSTINFLLFDHWGGLNTMFHTISNAGTIITLKDRNPFSICETIEKYKIELLPASPTFLNLLIISGAFRNYDLSSLKVISYGTEPMPQTTLHKLRELFPGIKLQQTYGLIELGVLRSKSKSNDSLWVKIGGEGFKTRVVDGILQIKAESAMLGYINAPSPFTDDGYFITGDAVEVDGEYFKILGRKSEIINVGGEKVYPSEIESVIQQYDNIADVIVYGEKNPIMGNIVCANISLIEQCADEKEFVRKLKVFCRGRLLNYQVPVKIFVSADDLYGDRYKKNRADFDNGEIRTDLNGN